MEFTPVKKGEKGREVPFSAINGLHYQKKELQKMITFSHKMTFPDNPFPRDRDYNNILEMFPVYSVLAGNNVKSDEAVTVALFRHKFSNFLASKALYKILSMQGIENTKGIAVFIRLVESTFFSLSPDTKDDILQHDAIVIIRPKQPVDEILHFSLDAVLKIFERFFKSGTSDKSLLQLYAKSVTDEIIEENIVTEKALKILEMNTLPEYSRKSGTMIKNGKEKIEQKLLSLSFINKFLEETEDYLLCDPDEPLSLRVLLDALSSVEWEFDSPGYLTRHDAEKIYSQDNLMTEGEYRVHIDELRPIATLKEILRKERE